MDAQNGGVVWGADDLTFARESDGGYVRAATASERTTTWKLNDDLAESVTGFFVDNVRVYPASSTHSGNRRLALRLSPGNADFKREIESSMAVVLRFADGQMLLFVFTDTAEPYFSSVLTGDALALLNAKFVGASRGGRGHSRVPHGQALPRRRAEQVAARWGCERRLRKRIRRDAPASHRSAERHRHSGSHGCAPNAATAR